MSPASAARTASSVARSQAVAALGRSASSEPSPRSTTASPERKPSCGSPPARLNVPKPGHRIPSAFSSSTGSMKEQLPTATSCSPRRARAPRRRPRGRASGEPPASSASSPVERVLVARTARGEDVEEAVLAVGRRAVVQAGRRLEGDPRLAAGREEAAELGARRHLGAAAAHLRAQAALGELVDLLLQLVAQRQLDVGLAGQPIEAGLPARLDRLDARGRRCTARRRGRESAVLSLELGEP